jgi:hypothetical protein
MAMTRDELIEALAAIEHERWSDWQEYVHESCGHDEYDRLILDPDRYNGWKRQIATPYADLSEREKQSDREQVMRYWPLLVEFFASWIEVRGDDCSSQEIADELRKEMGVRNGTAGH